MKIQLVLASQILPETVSIVFQQPQSMNAARDDNVHSIYIFIKNNIWLIKIPF